MDIDINPFSAKEFVLLMQFPPERATNSNSNLNSKTLFYKDCSLGSFKNLSHN